MRTKRVDSKGRLMLGKRMAGRTVVVNDSDPERIVIISESAVPERERWLYKNKEALRRVRQGLKQARLRRFSDTPPDLDADTALASRIEE